MANLSDEDYRAIIFEGGRYYVGDVPANGMWAVFDRKMQHTVVGKFTRPVDAMHHASALNGRAAVAEYLRRAKR